MADEPGRPAAISPISCESTPWGNEYASSSLFSTIAPRRGSLPMLEPMVRRCMPGSASWLKPRSAKSPVPTTRTVVKWRGWPVSLKTVSSSSMKRCGSAWPAPEPPTTNVWPSLTSSTASRTLDTIHGMYAPALGLRVWPVNSDEAIGEQEQDRVGDLVGAAEAAERRVAQAAPCPRRCRPARCHVRHGHERRHSVDADAARADSLPAPASARSPALAALYAAISVHAHLPRREAMLTIDPATPVRACAGSRRGRCGTTQTGPWR